MSGQANTGGTSADPWRRASSAWPGQDTQAPFPPRDCWAFDPARDRWIFTPAEGGQPARPFIYAPDEFYTPEELQYHGQLRGLPFNVAVRPSRSSKRVASLKARQSRDLLLPLELLAPDGLAAKDARVIAYISRESGQSTDAPTAREIALLPMLNIDLWTVIRKGWDKLRPQLRCPLQSAPPNSRYLDLTRVNVGLVNDMLAWVRSMENPPFWLEPKIQSNAEEQKRVWLFTVTWDLATAAAPLVRDSGRPSSTQRSIMSGSLQPVDIARLKASDIYMYSFYIAADDTVRVKEDGTWPYVCIGHPNLNGHIPAKDFVQFGRSHLWYIFHWVLYCHDRRIGTRITVVPERFSAEPQVQTENSWLKWLLEENERRWTQSPYEGYFWAQRGFANEKRSYFDKKWRVRINVGMLPIDRQHRGYLPFATPVH